MSKVRAGEAGFTLVELSVSMVIISIIVVSLFGLFITLVNSARLARARAVALTLATNQMEYLKSLPYDSLVVVGGSIIGNATVQPTVTKTLNNVPYTIKTNIDYVDDAYDNCGNYPSNALKLQYCRNSATSTPTSDTNPNDYKDARVGVYSASGTQLASVDTQIAARVSETASNTGAIFITVVDGSGTPVSGVAINVSNATTSPVVNANDTTDSNGISIIYGAPPDNGNDYVITATKSGYSSLSTIAANGSLQPTFANQKVISQQSSSVTLVLYPMTTNSLAVETTDSSGNPLGNVKVYAKGGYKKYTATTDTSYYYDAPAAVTTDSGGNGGLSNLVPSPNGYIFCGDNGATGCSSGGTTYYLASAVPYGGVNSLAPVAVPTYNAANPPVTTYAYNGVQYVQKVRLMLTTNANSPRVFSMNPYQLSLGSAGSLSNFLITLTGYNLSNASAKLTLNGTTYPGSSCNATITQLKCSYNLSGISAGTASLTVTNSSGALTLPVTPLGGFNVNP